MADVNKSKLQLRFGLPVNDDKTPSPATKLLINHGKPNFTIPRLRKTQNGYVNPTSPIPPASCHVNNNSNEFIVKSTSFNGVFKPSNISPAAKQTLSKNGNSITNNDAENEATKVILRRPKFVQTEMRSEQDDENIPEFIRRQRRIQERLANQNILDFENRRSGYFTQVMISPTSPNRQSFVETMASPAVKPGLEIPPPPTQHEGIMEETTAKEQHEFEDIKETILAEPDIRNAEVEEEEVAKAIEEVNKAVEGEDDDKADLEHDKDFQQEDEQSTEFATEELNPENGEKQQGSVALEDPHLPDILVAKTVVTSATEIFTHTSDPLIEEKLERLECNNAAQEEHLQNGHSNGKILDNEITISHTNGLNNPIPPTPDPKGEKSVNFEPKTIISFSQELGSGDNKYPDTVKVVKDVGTSEVNSELKELNKLKFEIKTNDQDVEVKPIIRTETA